MLVDFKNGDALLIPTSITIEIHHRKIPDGTLEDVAEWGMDLIDITGGAWNTPSPVETHVGLENYPALIQDYNRHGSSKARNVYLISGEDAYILLLSASSRWENGLEIFDKMLISFQLPESNLSEQTID